MNITKIKPTEGIKMFASYHFLSNDETQNGFGNWIGEVNQELYSGKPEKFLIDIQTALENELYKMYGKKFQVKILWFK